MRNTAFLAALGALCTLLAAPVAQAHPHVFVDVSHELIFDAEGRLVALRASWSYDEMFSLLMVEDGGYDANRNGAVEGAELERFRLWDADWPEDFGGDVEMTLDGAPLALGPPGDWAADWVEGRAVSAHSRALSAPVDIAGRKLVIRPFDPGYYTAYTLVAAPRFSGRAACPATLYEPDPGAVSGDLAAAVAELGADMTPEAAGLPQLGGLLAEEAVVTCPAK